MKKAGRVVAPAFHPSSAGGRGVRFLHTADWQLGMTRHFLDADAQPRYTGARIDAIARIGEIAAGQDCEFVLVCGDVFESNAVSQKVLSRSLEAMRSIPVPVYLLPGNHDPLDASSVYTSAAFTRLVPPNVHVLDRSGVFPVRPGVEIVAAPWFSKRPLTDLVARAVAELPEGACGAVRIVAGHGAVDTLSPDPSAPAVIDTGQVESALASGAVQFLALGDRHSPTDVGGSGRIWYSGTQEVTDYDEIEPGQVLVVDVSAESVSVASHRVGSWALKNMDFAVDDTNDLDDMESALAGLSGKDRTVLRLSLTGTLSLADKARLDTLLDVMRELFAAVEIWDRHTDIAVTIEGDELVGLGVSGYAQAAAEELHELAAANDGADRATARRALSLLYRLAGGAA